VSALLIRKYFMGAQDRLKNFVADSTKSGGAKTSGRMSGKHWKGGGSEREKNWILRTASAQPKIRERIRLLDLRSAMANQTIDKRRGGQNGPILGAQWGCLSLPVLERK